MMDTMILNFGRIIGLMLISWLAFVGMSITALVVNAILKERKRNGKSHSSRTDR